MPYDPKMHNISELHQKAEERQSLCPHPVRLCCHSEPNLYCPPDDTIKKKLGQNRHWRKADIYVTQDNKLARDKA